jgi:5-methylcytosine-specific restriction endonuclease McrA
MALKETILELRTAGMTYNQIAKTIPCAKSTVSYYCGKDVKNNTLKYQEERRKKNPLIQKMENFRGKLSDMSRDFQRRSGSKLKNKMERKFTIQELESLINKDPTCYLTGRKLDISKPETYSLDHFVPASKGGKNTLDNLRLVCREANSAKHDMLYEEFIQLCREVVQRYDGKK